MRFRSKRPTSQAAPARRPRWRASTGVACAALLSGGLGVAGMTTAPPEPVYPVMVIAPLFVVKVNWAFAARGIARKPTNVSAINRFRMLALMAA